MNEEDRERKRQLWAGMGILAVITVLIVVVLLGWGYLPGELGKYVGLVVGILTSPFLMEIFCVVVAFVVVITLNQWRRNRSGDDFVEIEVEDTGSSKNDDESRKGS